jgi:phage tail-like protein
MTGPTAAGSSYLRYLPPVLWEGEAAAAREVSLGQLLLIFEKVLTGVRDGNVLVHGDHEHASISTQIALLHRVFDAWAAPESFLRWLAAGLALAVPTLRDEPLWTEYQRRVAIAEIATVYPIRGTKPGLVRYLELFSARRARIAIDDGARLLTLTPRADAVAPVAPLVTQGPVLSNGRIVTEGLLRPWCIALTSDGGLVVGDIAMPDVLGLPFRSRVWRLNPSGSYPMTGAPPSPRPLATDTLALNRVVGVTVRAPRAGAPETLYVLDRDGRIFALAAPFDRATLLTTGGVADAPVAMTVDTRSGDLLVLDRGGGVGTLSAPKIITIRTDPWQVTARTDLRTVKEPLSLAVDPDGALLIGDGRDQAPTAPEQRAGNLIRVDRATTPWTETALLDADNPLVAPTGLARTRDGVLYVLDAGLKPFAPARLFPFVSAVAAHAGVFRVASGAPTTVSRVTEPGLFVYPTGMVATGGRLVVCDPGQPSNGWPLGDVNLKRSRAQPFQFDVVVHFTADRVPRDDVARRPVVRRVISNVRAIVERERPAHVRCNVISSS